jgi:TonB family protein
VGAGSGTGAGGRGSGAGSRPGGQGGSIDIGGLTISGGSVGARTESPNTSTFDVVVVSQNSREILPESAGVLSGQPIYTVYLSVPGSRREWILQFAVPNSREPVQSRSANAIQLGAATPVRAPFPLRKADLKLGPEAAAAQGRVVVYGNISAKGSVEDLRVIRSVQADIDLAVMACLKQFQFRPAVRDGVPVMVEALFGIPLN